jgi:hypothetical protein
VLVRLVVDLNLSHLPLVDLLVAAQLLELPLLELPLLEVPLLEVPLLEAPLLEVKLLRHLELADLVVGRPLMVQVLSLLAADSLPDQPLQIQPQNRSSTCLYK